MVKLFYSLTNGIAIFVYTLTNGKWVLSWRDIDSDFRSIVKLRTIMIYQRLVQQSRCLPVLAKIVLQGGFGEHLRAPALLIIPLYYKVSPVHRFDNLVKISVGQNKYLRYQKFWPCLNQRFNSPHPSNAKKLNDNQYHFHVL